MSDEVCEAVCDACGEPVTEAEQTLCEGCRVGIRGYHDCECCGETIIDRRFCDACHAAGCPATVDDRVRDDDDCQIPQCLDCADMPRASLMNDGRWHSNCEAPCPNAGKDWATS